MASQRLTECRPQLIHRVRNGQRVEDAVEDIISRSVEELRKNAFGDDMDDANNLPWSREQAWAIAKSLARNAEVPASRGPG